MKRKSYLVLLLIVLLFGCEKDDDNQSDENINNPINLEKGATEVADLGRIIYQPNSISFNQSLKNLVTQVNPGFIEMTYNQSLDLVEIGDVLFSGPIEQSDSGFARKVTSIEKNGNSVTFFTETALWVDTFALVDYSGVINPIDLRNFQPYPSASIEIETGSIGIGINYELEENSMELGLTLDFDDDFDTTIDQLNITGGLTMSTPVSPSVVLYSNGTIQNTVMSLSGLTQITPSLSLTIGGSPGVTLEDIEGSQNQALSELLNKRITIGRVPTPISISAGGNLNLGVQWVFFAVLEIDISGKLTLEFSKELVYQYNVSFDGSRVDKWMSDLNQTNNDPIETNFIISNSINIEASPLDTGIQLTFPQFGNQEEQFFGVFVSPYRINGGGEIIYNVTTDCFDINTNLSSKSEFYFESKLSGILPEWIESFDARVSIFEIDHGGNNDDEFPELCAEELVYDGNVILSSQQEVYDFTIDNYTEINGYLHIGGSGSTNDITDISGFSNLTSINGDEFGNGLRIENTQLVSIGNLSSLTAINGTIDFVSNSNLNDISELSDITASGNIQVFNCDSLTSLIGLHNIQTSGAISISNNNNLTQLRFDNLTTIFGAFRVVNNANLSNLGQVNNITNVNEIRITNNSMLNNFCGLNTLISNNGISEDYTVLGNLYNPTLQDLIDGNCSN